MIRINEFRIDKFQQRYYVYYLAVDNVLSFGSLRSAIEFVTGWSNANLFKSRIKDF